MHASTMHLGGSEQPFSHGTLDSLLSSTFCVMVTRESVVVQPNIIVLSGAAPGQNKLWTSIAQEYPELLARRIAHVLAESSANLCAHRTSRLFAG